MSVNLKNPETEKLLHALADATGETLTEAATVAFRERLERLNQQNGLARHRELTSLLDLINEARSAPVVDPRPVKEIRNELWGEG